MIRCHLSKILGERKMTKSRLANTSGIGWSTISKLYQETWQTIDKDNIDRICLTLQIPIQELFEVVSGPLPTNKRKRNQDILPHHYRKEAIERNKIKPKTNFRESLIKAGVNNLNAFGFPECNQENILTDEIYKMFFMNMLNQNKGHGEEVDQAIEELLKTCEEGKSKSTTPE